MWREIRTEAVLHNLVRAYQAQENVGDQEPSDHPNAATQKQNKIQINMYKIENNQPTQTAAAVRGFDTRIQKECASAR